MKLLAFIFEQPSYSLVLISNSLNSDILNLFCRPFLNHSNGKSKIYVRILHLGYSSYKPIG